MLKTVLLADAMLKSLCRRLRLLGVACDFAEDLGLADDEQLIKHAMRNKMILLTRDEELWKKARDYVKCLLVPSKRVEEQAAFVLKQLKLKPRTMLCARCGGKVRKVVKQKIRQLVFPRVYSAHREFWLCGSCRAVYWKGSHWPSLRKALRLVAKLVSLKR